MSTQMASHVLPPQLSFTSTPYITLLDGGSLYSHLPFIHSRLPVCIFRYPSVPFLYIWPQPAPNTLMGWGSCTMQCAKVVWLESSMDGLDHIPCLYVLHHYSVTSKDRRRLEMDVVHEVIAQCLVQLLNSHESDSHAQLMCGRCNMVVIFNQWNKTAGTQQSVCMQKRLKRTPEFLIWLLTISFVSVLDPLRGYCGSN